MPTIKENVPVTRTPRPLYRTLTAPVGTPNILNPLKPSTLLNDQDHFLSNDLNNGPIETFLRIRPIDNMEQSVIEILDDRRVRLSAPSESHAFKTKNRHDGIFLFNRVFNGDTSQENLFNEIGKPAVESVVVSGQNRTILCYGVTNAGKSFTIYGTPDNSGLVLRSIGSILTSIGQNHSDIPLKPFRFNEVELQKQDDYKPLQECLSPDDNEYEYALFFSAYENYGDKIFDLFDTTHESLDLKRAPTSKRAVYVDKLSKHRIRSLSDAQVLLDRVHKYRRVEATQHNSMSSRSHALFLLQLIKIPKFDLGVIEDYSQIIKYTSMSTLMFVDLAGSERCSTMTTTERRKEAGAINNSLSALQACIRDIRGKTSNSRGGEFVSFRNSKLTQILEYELTSSQKGALTFIININPSHKCYDETSHVMEFSAIARELKPQPLSKIDSGLSNNGLNRLVQKGSMKNFSSLKKPLSASIKKLTGKFREFSNENSPTTNNGKASNQNLLRNEMVDDYTRNIAEMEEFYNDMLKNMLEEAEERSSKKLELLTQSYDAQILEYLGDLEYAASIIELKDREIEALNARLAPSQDNMGPTDDMETLRKVQEGFECQLKVLEKQLLDSNQQLENLKEKEKTLTKRLKQKDKLLKEKEVEIMRLRKALLVSSLQSSPKTCTVSKKKLSHVFVECSYGAEADSPLSRRHSVPHNSILERASKFDGYQAVCEDEDGVFVVDGEMHQSPSGGVQVVFNDAHIIGNQDTATLNGEELTYSCNTPKMPSKKHDHQDKIKKFSPLFNATGLKSTFKKLGASMNENKAPNVMEDRNTIAEPDCRRGKQKLRPKRVVFPTESNK